jgi:hypothetical protein
MKRLLGLLVLFLFSISSQQSAQTSIGLAYSDPNSPEATSAKKTSKLEIRETNYLTGLSTGNAGIQASSAYFLGEMKSEKALFPLMKMFRDAKTDGEKLLAAWSLLKIGDSRGIYLVKRETETGNNENIQVMLQFLYMDYCLKTKGQIDHN